MTRLPAGWDRRTFLGASAATVSGLYLSGCAGEGEATRRIAPPEPEPNDGAELVDFAPEALSVDELRYALGVSAGGMTATSVLLWTQVQGPAGRLRVWRDSGVPGKVKLAADVEVEANDGFIKAEVTGLGPGYYQYAFFDEALTVRSPIGRFRTAFAKDDLRPLSIGVMACTNFEKAPYKVLEMLATEQVDLLCHLGDISYNGASTREGYRQDYRRTFQDPGYRAVLPTAGLYATWDDHEVANDFNPEKMAIEEPEKLQAATDAYFEHMPIPETAPRRIWHRFSWGATADVFVLDCRGERKPSTRQSDEGIYISPEQLQWLMDGLEDSTAHFKVILSSVPITRFFGLWDVALYDRWQGYGVQRERLIEHINQRVSGRVLFLSGDFHCGYAGRVEPEGAGRQIFEVTTSTGARNPNPIAVFYDTGDLTPADTFPPERFAFGTGHAQHMTTLVLDPLNDEVRLKVLDGYEETRGEVLFDGLIPFSEV